MKKAGQILFVFLIFSQSFAGGIDWKYEQPYTDEFLYLHSFVNYSYNAFWKFDWERNLVKTNGIKLNFGSVTTADLQSDSRLVFNQKIGDGWRFKGNGNYRANRFENSHVENLFVGMEKTIINNVGLFFLINPLYNKEFTDISFGALISNDNREKYLSAEIKLEDFLYNEKNDFDGKSVKDPIVLNWELRYGIEKFWFYFGGRLTNGFERKFDNSELSPEMIYHSQKVNRLNANLYYLFADRSIISFSYYYYSFAEAKQFYDQEFNYSYSNKINDIAIEIIYNFKEMNNFRLVSHYLFQRAGSSGFNAHDFERNETMNGLFYERIIGNNFIEVGYMFSIFNWDYNSQDNEKDYYRKDNSSKVKLSWTYKFKNNAQLQFSLSHEIDTNGFGGGNLQYQMFF